MNNQHKHFYEFEGFRLDPKERQLRSQGKILPLTPKAFHLLLLLVENGGHALRKGEFLEKVWAGSYVEEKNLADNISLLRKVLGDDPKAPSLIETVPRLGYRFVADVREVREEGAALLLAERSRERVVIEEEIDPTPALTAGAEPALTLPAKPRNTKMRFAVVVVVFLMLALSVAAYYLARRGELRPVQPQQFKSLAVLPLKPLDVTAADGDDSYLGPGLADALITKLSNLRQIAVRPTSAVLKYAGPQSNLVAVAREQRVDAVLDGSFQRVGDRVRVTVQLVRGSDGASLWAQTFDEKLTDMFSVQDAISSRVVEALKIKLSNEEERRFARKQTDNVEAYQLYLRGRYHWNRRTADGINKAVEYLSQAVSTDPSYALAHAGLADAYALLPEYTNAPLPESIGSAKAAALKALEIDNTFAEAHVSLAYVKYCEWDWAGIEDQFKRGLELNPNYATGHQWYSEYLIYQGRLDEAMREIRQAQQLDPLSLIINARVGITFYYSRRYDEAIDQLHKTLELNPDFILTHIFLYASLFEKGMHRETIPHIVRGFFNSYSPEEKARLERVLTSAYAGSGERGMWEKVRDTLKSTEKRDYNYSYNMAETCLRLGDKDEAFLWLGRAADVRHPGLAALKVEPSMDVLHADPRFAELLRRVNLPQ